MDGWDGFWRGIALIARVAVRLLGWDLRVEGLAHVPRRRGAVLAFNHHGYADVVPLGWGPIVELRRPVRFLAKAELFEHPLTRWMARRAGAIRVVRGAGHDRSRAGVVAAAVEALRRGELVAVAPEQTISASYELLPFKHGAASMAIAADVPIVPAVGWGSHRTFPKGRSPGWRRGVPVVIRYGEPLRPARDETVPALTARLRARMTSMLDELQRSYPDRPAPGDDWWVPARLGGSAPRHEDVITATRRRFEQAAAARAAWAAGAAGTSGIEAAAAATAGPESDAADGGADKRGRA